MLDICSLRVCVSESVSVSEKERMWWAEAVDRKSMTILLSFASSLSFKDLPLSDFLPAIFFLSFV